MNLSVGYEFDAEWFACGQSPLCVEVDRLVKTGVVVVVAAGNTGYGTLAASARGTSTGLALTINDPGNAELAITVGATHRDMPHTYGVSYFSSKGPTGDGRLKPDLVAPGERITSVAAGSRLQGLCTSLKIKPTRTVTGYLDDTGTSMAAPHVSGAIAAFLSIRREFIGNPERVKSIFKETATPLGRTQTFEGRGLVDPECARSDRSREDLEWQTSSRDSPIGAALRQGRHARGRRRGACAHHRPRVERPARGDRLQPRLEQRSEGGRAALRAIPRAPGQRPGRPGSRPASQIRGRGRDLALKLWADDGPGGGGGAAALDAPISDADRVRHLKGAFDGPSADHTWPRWGRSSRSSPPTPTLRRFHTLWWR